MSWRAAILGLLFSANLFAQPHGNEWIRFNQNYLKIPVSKDAVYRINHNELQAALSSIGVSISSIDPRSIQIFGRGAEEFIHVEGEADGSFDPSDYIIFRGKRNDGWLDAEFYAKPEHQINPHYSNFNDTAHYFFTWTSSLVNKRLKPVDNVNFRGKTALNYVWKKNLHNAATQYNEGPKDAGGVSSPLYIEGEGWMIPWFGINQQRHFALSTKNAYTASGAPDAVVMANTAGKSNAAQNPNHGMNISYVIGSTVVLAKHFEYTGYEMHQHQITIPSTQLASSVRMYFSQKLTPVPPSDFQAVAFGEITFPHGKSLSGESDFPFHIPTNTDTSYLNFSAYSGTATFAYDFENGYLIRTVQSGSSLSFLVPPGSQREINVLNDNQISPISAILPVTNFKDGQGRFTDYSKLEEDSALILISHRGLENEAKQYASFKRNKGMNVLFIYIEDLYDQFSYGIQKHPLAVNHLSHYLLKNWATKPSGLFVIGKSIKESITRRNRTHYGNNKLPTFGIPPADNMFSTKLDGSDYVPEIPVGRLAANDANEVLIYLEKIRGFESSAGQIRTGVDDMIWQKRGLHLAGGGNINEQTVFKRYLDSYANTWRDTLQGGVIHNFDRFLSGAVQNVQFDSIEILINQGVSLLSFFGHGSGGELGINIGEPSDFSNRGKYPLFLANSCNVGDYHLPRSSTSTLNERWIFSNNSGAIGFLASTSLGYPSVLNGYSTALYRNLCLDNYGKSIGVSMRETVRDVQLSSSFMNRTCLEMNLHGDPTIKLYPKKDIDFAIERQHVSAPQLVSTDNGFFNLDFTIYNLGKGVNTEVAVDVTRLYPNGHDTTYKIVLNGIAFSQSVSLPIFIADRNSIGENIFKIHVNPERRISESFPIENNVVGNIRINVTSDDLLPILPYDYAIVPDGNITLKASTADPFAPERDYIFEIDLTDSFNSNMLKRAQVRGKGGVIEWNPQLYHTPDSVVYYWRCSPKKETPAELKWRESSFQIIPEQHGWSQYQFAQLKNNKYAQMSYSRQPESIDFNTGRHTVSGTNSQSNGSNKWSLDGSQQGRAGVCANGSSMLITIIDNKTVEAWETRWIDNSGSTPIEYNANRNYGNFNDPSFAACPQRDKKFMFLTPRAGQMDSMINMINKHVPDSFYVLAMSFFAGFQDSSIWKDRHFKAFEALGADSIRTIPSNNPYIFFGQKGNKSKAVQIIAKNPSDLLSISVSFDSKIDQGKMQSTRVGPSKKWKSFNWNSSKKSSHDSIRVNLYGYDLKGEKQFITTLNNGLVNEVEMDRLEWKYPQMKSYRDLEFETIYKDSLEQSAPELRHWQIMYDEVPEAAILPNDQFYFSQDTVKQGQEVKLAVKIKNVSSINMDSLRVRYYLVGRNELIELPYPMQAPLLAGKDMLDTLVVKTRTLGGMYTLIMDVNPEDSLWQPEKHHFNNILSKSFFVISDIVNPLLDVTFDGVHILDGDIVSARPEIQISLNDENEFMPLEDTSSFEVFLTSPDGSSKQIYFIDKEQGEQMVFHPASGKKNKANIEYKPILKVDGIYQLRVKAKDASGNQSGANDYMISFEVINKSTITNVMNYPNPFTTSTRFVFTLTGYKIPEYFRIQILSISGRVVKEINQDELGNIHIGRNVTQYAWDGTDTYGDRMGNGVYFYRVITKIEGEDIELRSSGADQYFKKGFGKMVMFR